MAKSPKEMGEAIARNLEKKTGKSFDQWIRLTKLRAGIGSPATPVKQLREWLQKEHGLGSVTAHFVASEAVKPKDYVEPSADDLLGAQFTGEKEKLRPVYDAIVKAASKVGKEVDVAIRKTQTTLIRGATFAIIKAPTKKHMDIGLRLPGVAPTSRLEATTAFSDNATHRVRVGKKSDVDAELRDWLKAAYLARGKK